VRSAACTTSPCHRRGATGRYLRRTADIGHESVDDGDDVHDERAAEVDEFDVDHELVDDGDNELHDERAGHVDKFDDDEFDVGAGDADELDDVVRAACFAAAVADQGLRAQGRGPVRWHVLDEGLLVMGDGAEPQ